jgi:hypothetical protein
VSEMLLMSLASSGRRYGRETRAAHRRIVSEVYSPPRVTAEAKKGRHPHIVPGFAFDLTVNDPDDGQPWDFSIKAKRDKARAKFNRQKPYMLIGSPSCTEFSTWMALNEAKSSDVAALRRAKIRAIVHIDFVIELYQDQLADGRYFLHEHPEHATSWQLSRMQNLMDVEGVVKVGGDQCQFGAEHQRGAAEPAAGPRADDTRHVRAHMPKRQLSTHAAYARPYFGVSRSKDAMTHSSKMGASACK